jgi:hypothetical protein
MEDFPAVPRRNLANLTRTLCAVFATRGTDHLADPPPEMRLEIVWQEHELGNYPTIGLVWDDPMRGTPWNYISRCEVALTAYENNGELPPGWSMPPVSSDDEDEFDDDYLNSETPPEPPANIDFFEIQRYTSKLTEWALKASARRRHRPRLVESDDHRADDTEA